MNGGEEITADAQKGVQFARVLMEKAPPQPKPYLLDALWELDTLRPFVIAGMDNKIVHGFIPVDKIHWYAECELQLDDDERQAFVWIIRRADSAYVSLKNSKLR